MYIVFKEYVLNMLNDVIICLVWILYRIYYNGCLFVSYYFLVSFVVWLNINNEMIFLVYGIIWNCIVRFFSVYLRMVVFFEVGLKFDRMVFLILYELK